MYEGDFFFEEEDDFDYFSADAAPSSSSPSSPPGHGGAVTLDDFNRADGLATDLTHPWVTFGSFAPPTYDVPKIDTLQVPVDIALSYVLSAYWDDQFLADQECSIKMPSLGSQPIVGVAVRVNDLTGWTDGYMLAWAYTGDWDILSGGFSGTSILNGTGLSAPEGLRIVAVGDQISAYYWDGATWQLLGTQTDTDWTGDGYLGLIAMDLAATTILDDFGGGEVASVIEYTDANTVYVDIQVQGDDVFNQETTDAATVLVDIQCSGVEALTHDYTDAGTVLVVLQTSGTEIHTTFDADTVYVNIQNMGGECYSTAMGDTLGEGDPFLEWDGLANLQFSGDANLEWRGIVSVGESVHC